MKLNIIALGDVGQNLLLGLKLLGGEAIDEIGIYDINENLVKRLEIEMGQIAVLKPRVMALSEEELLCCDALVFCASRGVPPVGAEGDVRMAQLEANGELVRALGERIAKSDSVPDFVFIMSDPVDQLCNMMLESSGLAPEKIRGLGLGVMNARAVYYAKRDERFSSYLNDGRVFGPHGKDLVVANSITEYDDELSRELTELVVNANREVRELGYKPYIAPAISSGALSIIGVLKGEWTYGSVYMTEAISDEAEGASASISSQSTDGKATYFGMLSRWNGSRWETEDAELPASLKERIAESYRCLIESE